MSPLAVVTSKHLRTEQVHAVGVAALDNALGLMGDAALLLGAGRYHRAYALGVIAVEEVAKYLYCRHVLFHWTSGITVADLNVALRPRGGAHVERCTFALDFLWGLTGRTVPLPPGFRDLKGVAKVDMIGRERALYVEVAPTGEPRTPAGVSEYEARGWLSGMIGHFAMLEKVWRESLDDALTAARRGGRGQPDE